MTVATSACSSTKPDGAVACEVAMHIANGLPVRRPSMGPVCLACSAASGVDEELILAVAAPIIGDVIDH